MSDNEEPRTLQVQTPDIPGGEVAADVIIKILQHEPIELDHVRLDDVFFSVLQSFEVQAREAGFSDEENPFAAMEKELRAYLAHVREVEYANVPEEYKEDMRRFKHMSEEATNDPGLLVPAIRILEKVAEKVDPDAHPEFWGDLQNDLGITYVELPVAAREKAIEKAIVALKAAVAARPPEKDPYKHLAALHNLGNAYLNSPLGKRHEQLAAALATFEAARRYVDKDQMRGDYAILMLNQGTALALLPMGNRAANLKKAEECFFEAVRIFSPDFPAGWGLVQSRWGQALHYGEPADLQRAIFHYDNALSVYGLEESGVMWDYIAITVQRTKAALAQDPTSTDIAAEALSALLPVLDKPRTSQQHAQLMMAFGPPYNGQLRSRRLAEIEAALASETDGLARVGLQLDRVAFDPARAGAHIRAAIGELN